MYKVVIVVGSNSAGVWGRSPSRRKQPGVRGRIPWRWGYFYSFSPKIRIL